MLSFLAECGKCGRPLEGKQDSGEMPGYRCQAGCCMTRVPWLDAFIEQLAVRKLSDPVTYERLTAPDDGWRAAARAEAATLEARLAEAADAFADGTIPIAALQQIEATLRPKLEAVNRRLNAVTVAGPVRTFLDGGSLDDIAVRWEAAPVAVRKASVRFLFDRIALQPGQPGAPRGSRATLDPRRVEWEWREELR
jgi:hypothetical protein